MNQDSNDTPPGGTPPVESGEIELLFTYKFNEMPIPAV